MPILYIIRGLPGSGKTTLANKTGAIVLSPADMYSMRGGEYQWTEERGRMGKEWALEIFEFCLLHEIDIAIAEVLPTIKDVREYVDPALKAGYKVYVHDCLIPVDESIMRNTHGVPAGHILEMAGCFEPWKLEVKDGVLIDESDN